MMKSPYQSKYADTLGYRTHYIEEGEGDVVILIHGGGPGGDSYGNWFGCLKSFSKAYRTIAYDMVGYGNTEDREDHHHSQGNRNAQLIAFIEALGVGAVDVVGNSMGGAVCVGAAMQRPDLIDNMVLMGSAGLDHAVGKVKEGMQVIAKHDFTIESMRRIASHLGGKMTPVPGMIEYRHELASRPSRIASFGKIDTWVWEHAGLHYEEADIAKIKTRALVFAGKDDPIVRLPQSFRYLELLENSTGYIMPHCGHWAMLQHPDLFTKVALEFLGVYNPGRGK